MAKQVINIGATPNDNTGDSLRDGMDKVNDNFTELYAFDSNISKSTVGLGNVDNTADSSKPVSTAQQAAINAAVVGLYDDRGNYNASGNTYPTTGGSGTAGAILKGDIWTISVAGTLGGIVLKAGDTLRALQDTPAQTDANWAIVQTGLTSAQINAITFATPATIAYQTEIPFTRMLTIITGKTLASNDTFTIGANPVEGAGAQTWLDGNGTNAPVFTNFDYQNGAFSSTSGQRNLITMEYIGGKSIVSILNLTAV